jgi:hypothetical protein
MIKRIMIILAAVMFFAAAAADIFAQDVLMNSAETIKKGNFKVAVFPTVLFGKNGSDSIFGVAGRAGFGITSSFDIEAKAAFFKDLNYFGVDVEYWFVHGNDFNVSVALGGHMTNVPGGGDSSGIDTTLLCSTTPSKNLELYGGLKLAFDSLKNSDYNFTLVHVVPGLEYRISDALDFLAEFGIALNDNSRSYASVGLALYFLR